MAGAGFTLQVMSSRGLHHAMGTLAFGLHPRRPRGTTGATGATGATGTTGATGATACQWGLLF